jgi:hypothetical protein
MHAQLTHAYGRDLSAVGEEVADGVLLGVPGHVAEEDCGAVGLAGGGGLGGGGGGLSLCLLGLWLGSLLSLALGSGLLGVCHLLIVRVLVIRVLRLVIRVSGLLGGSLGGDGLLGSGLLVLRGLLLGALVVGALDLLLGGGRCSGLALSGRGGSLLGSRLLLLAVVLGVRVVRRLNLRDGERVRPGLAEQFKWSFPCK